MTSYPKTAFHFSAQISYREAPVHILDSINAYVKDRQKPGGFLTAVFENNLTAALGGADNASRRGLDDIIEYLRHEVPAICWGSPAKVAAWLGEETPKTQVRRVIDQLQEDLLLTANARALEAYLDAALDIGSANANREDHHK
jgi:hypothetical protein